MGKQSEIMGLNGFIDWNGNFFACGPHEHTRFADTLAPKGVPNAELWLERAGWVKVRRGMFALPEGRAVLTTKQARFISQLCRQYGIDVGEEEILGMTGTFMAPFHGRFAPKAPRTPQQFAAWELGASTLDRPWLEDGAKFY